MRSEPGILCRGIDAVKVEKGIEDIDGDQAVVDIVSVGDKEDDLGVHGIVKDAELLRRQVYRSSSGVSDGLGVNNSTHEPT